MQGNQIYGFEVNEATGALTPLSGFPISTGGYGSESTQSEYLVIDAVNRRLYVLNDVDPRLSAYSIHPTTGALTPLPFHNFLLPVQDWATLAVHPSGSPLTIGEQGLATQTKVASYNLTATTATPAPGSPFLTGGGARLFGSVFSRDGNYYYGGGNIQTLVAGLSVNAGNGTLAPLPNSPFNGGAGYPSAYATDSAGRLYLTNYSLAQSSVFTTSNGIPTPVSGNPFANGGLTTVTDGVLHPNENFYVVTNRTPASVGVLQISGSGASTTLTPVAGSPVATGGTVANALVFNQAGNFLFVANATSRNITTFSFNPATGALTNLNVQPANTLGSSGRINGIGYIGAASVPPTVQITAPANNGTYFVGQSILVAASASDPDGTVQRVEFYDNGNLIGTDTTAPYVIALNSLSLGTHVLTAIAFDNAGSSTTSAPVNITVNTTGGPFPLPIGAPTLTSPATGTIFNAPTTITISATPSAGNYAVARIEFYLNGTLVGTDSTAPYSVTVSNIPAGRYTVFAKTVATSGAETISQPVEIVVNGTTAPPRRAFDFDGDGKADVSVFRPSDATWYLNRSAQGFTATQFGVAGDKLAPADYDNDGKTDIAVFRNGNWYILNSTNNQLQAVQFGATGDVPVPADYDGDGKADVAVFRQGIWYVLESSTSQLRGVQFGVASDKAVPADYDGDGKADLAVYRGGTWYLLGSQAGFSAVQFGVSTDLPVPADYDGDGKADVAVFRDGVWYMQQSTAGFRAVQFGASGDVPVAADYDGDGRTDVAVFRAGTWYMLGSTQGFTSVQFGQASDVPVPSAYVP